MAFPSSKSWLGTGYFKLLTWLGPRDVLHGLPVWMPLLRPQERAIAYERLNEALDLLRGHVPARYSRARRLLKGFIVFGTDSASGSYDPINGVCRLNEKFVTDPAATAVAIASTVVHEATHAWLTSLGVGYESYTRHRVELVCIKASLLAMRRIPGAEAEVARCRHDMSIDPEFFSNEKRIERSATHLRELGCPEWFVRMVVWIGRKRAA
jgi:hypothetical protein